MDNLGPAMEMIQADRDREEALAEITAKTIQVDQGSAEALEEIMVKTLQAIATPSPPLALPVVMMVTTMMMTARTSQAVSEAEEVETVTISLHFAQQWVV